MLKYLINYPLVIIALFSFLIPYRYALIIANIYAVIFPLLFLVLTIYASIKKNRDAYFLLAGFFILLIVIPLDGMHLFGIIPKNQVIDWAYNAGLIWLMLFSSLGLMDRIYLINRELKRNEEKLRIMNDDLIDANDEFQTQNEELKSTQTQLIHTEKMAGLGTLVAGIAHEINNPINYVHTNTYNLISEIKNFKKYVMSILDAENEEDNTVSEEFNKRFEWCSDILKDIKEGSTRIMTIVNDLRSFSRVDEKDMHKTNLVEGLRSTVRIVKAQFKNRISISENYEADPLVLCIPSQINQVFMNILTNACQAVEHEMTQFRSSREEAEPGEVNNTIEINTIGTKENFIIEVIDHGIGMNDETRKKMFDPFFTTKEQGKGIGMGLAISFGIIEKHNGRIEVETEQGTGTTFRIEIPCIE